MRHDANRLFEAAHRACIWAALSSLVVPTAARAQTSTDDAETQSASEADHDPLRLGPFQFGMFVDAYAAWQTNGTGTLASLSGHRAFSGQGANGRSENGFSLAFLGLDGCYDNGDFGVVASLRFGPAATLFHRHDQGDSDLSFGVDHLTRAYVLYRPVEQLELDLGMFMSPFGFEELESWKNPNYTISALYVYGQPNWHMGLKATWKLREDVTLMALVINGANNISETQQRAGLEQSPSVGGALSYDVSPALSLALGGFAALNPKHNDDGGFDVFVDFVSTLELGDLSGALNIDYVMTRDGAPSGAERNFIGGSLTAGYRLAERFRIAARGEYLRDDANFGDGDVWQLLVGTLTLDVRPILRRPYFVIRWENRWERSNQRVFGRDSRGSADPEDDSHRRSWFETVLGVVVTTAP